MLKVEYINSALAAAGEIEQNFITTVAEKSDVFLRLGLIDEYQLTWIDDLSLAHQSAFWSYQRSPLSLFVLEWESCDGSSESKDAKLDKGFTILSISCLGNTLSQNR